MAAGLTEAILRRAPRASDATGVDSVGKNFQTTMGAAVSVTNVATLPSGAPTSGGCWVTFVPSADCRIRFASGNPGAAVAADALFAAGQTQEFWIAYPDDANFSVISTAGGLLDRWRSSR